MHAAMGAAAAMASGPPPVGVVALTADTASDAQLSGFGTAFAAFTFSTNGIITRKDGATWTNKSNEWWSVGSVSGIGSSYQIRATLSSGTTPTGPTLGSTTWHDLSTIREWSHTRSFLGVTTCVLSISIRDTATQTIRATASFTLDATMEN